MVALVIVVSVVVAVVSVLAYRGLTAPHAPAPATSASARTSRTSAPIPTAAWYTGTLTGHTDGLDGVAFAPDGKTLATTSDDQTVRIWDAVTGRTLRLLTGHTARVVGVGYAPDGKTLATASWDHTARIWDVATSRPSVNPSTNPRLTSSGAPGSGSTVS